MKIVHIAPRAPYNDYWGYQDNLLPKYQRKLGHDVTVIVTNRMHRDGTIVETDCTDYVLSDGVRVIRRAYKRYPLSMVTGVFSDLDVYDLLEELAPDFIFYHGLVSYTIRDVVRYVKKHPSCRFVEDNHMDYNIGNPTKTVKDKLIRQWLRWLNREPSRYAARVYGVTPWRKTYAEDYFGIPKEKTDVLIMGADDEKIDFAHRAEIRDRIRREHGVAPEDFLLVTGGKIDKKKKIHILMEACAHLEGVKLLVFGNVADELKDEFHGLLQQAENIIYIGWIPSDRVYDYFFAADLVFFPGQHSVLWEQACACKVPCAFEKWEGMEHVNNGGNSVFLDDISVSGLERAIRGLIFTEDYRRMKAVAQSEATDIYLYSAIAEKSLECVAKR